ncbi:MAG: ubiquinol-cytochrome c reductase cytochrome b subunit [Actinobacteria bacterium]|nr:ubiquinol-cytochrome c reductase cytochrome b subunit [Actinomycetota bacterium]
MIEKLARAIDRRIGASGFAKDKADKVFPESWTFLFGEVALYAFVVLLITGTYLALFFDPSHTEVVYEGRYLPLRGEQMSAAYRSAIELSFDTRAGLLIRQMHHWAALVFVASIVVHVLRVFFTGAFRRPREINWVIGVTLLLLAIFEGFAGYSLLDDVLSGVGLRIGHGIVESIPLVGTWTASLLFGGEFPGEAILGRLFVGHVFLLPALMATLVGVHLALIVRQYHTQYPGPGRTQRNVVGVRVWPTYAAKSVGLFCIVFAVIAALGGLAQINPVWLYGPYDPFLVTTGAQPDWYLGWVEGALRLFPPWEITIGGYLIANPFYPAVLFPGLLFAALYAYPWIERFLTGDDRDHHLLDRPRDRPFRTAFGVAALTFLAVVFIAGSQDVIAYQLEVSLLGIIWFLRIGALVLPLLAFAIAYRVASDLKASSHRPAGEQAYRELEGGEDGGEAEGPQRWQVLAGALSARWGSSRWSSREPR